MKYRAFQRGDPGQTAGVTVEQDQSPGSAPSALGLQSTVPSSQGGEIDKFAETAPAPPAKALDSPEVEASEIPPSLYGRFEAFEFLGRGGMGAVYKARDLRLGREVALKLLFGADPERGGGLLREARAQARIAHENVCEV